MIRKATRGIGWQPVNGDSHHWELRTLSGQRLAEVECESDGTWLWYRTTTIAEHGVPPAGGREPSRREAQCRAAAGLA